MACCKIQCLSGWWLTYPSENYEFVSWDDDIPNIWKNKSHVPNHQPVEDVYSIEMVSQVKSQSLGDSQPDLFDLQRMLT
jgi:hypothetical protein